MDPPAPPPGAALRRRPRPPRRPGSLCPGTGEPRRLAAILPRAKPPPPRGSTLAMAASGRPMLRRAAPAVGAACASRRFGERERRIDQRLKRARKTGEQAAAAYRRRCSPPSKTSLSPTFSQTFARSSDGFQSFFLTAARAARAASGLTANTTWSPSSSIVGRKLVGPRCKGDPLGVWRMNNFAFSVVGRHLESRCRRLLDRPARFRSIAAGPPSRPPPPPPSSFFSASLRSSSAFSIAWALSSLLSATMTASSALLNASGLLTSATSVSLGKADCSGGDRRGRAPAAA